MKNMGINFKKDENKVSEVSEVSKIGKIGKIKSNQGFAIVDPCRVLSDDVYHNFWGKKKKFADGIFEVNGFSFAVGSTAHGDGVYYDTDCRKYPVDAGVIALIPLELVEDKSGLRYGNVFKMSGEAEFKCEDGIFDISLHGIFDISLPGSHQVHINTQYDEDDESDEYDDSDEYDEDNEDNEDDEYNNVYKAYDDEDAYDDDYDEDEDEDDKDDYDYDYDRAYDVNRKYSGYDDDFEE